MVEVKENVWRRQSLAAWWAAGGLAAAAALLAAAALHDAALPAPLSRAAPPHRFMADVAYDHLRNLTAIGPRVAGSYENEVLAVGVIVEAVKAIRRGAAPHHRIELDVHVSSGAFPLDFLDGMTNVYEDVSSVVVRLSGAGGRARPAPSRAALLFNCHIDTVPDSPGASDDGAGCAVMLETLRALAADRLPHRHDAIFLFNGAEENIMQASHGFITQHKWAKSVRAFVNIEACGAGGREVLFQAGPHHPWILETYAGSVPYPFASSFAQELFQSGLLPADTDFRIFRDFGRVSGLDLAWVSNGYVYHTRLDTAERVPRGALQRTGDNVLAVGRALLASPRLAAAGGGGSGGGEGQPVYFDVLGRWAVTVRAPAAAALALATVAAAALQLHVTARRAQADLLVPYWWWARAVCGAGGAVGGAVLVGLGCSVALAFALSAAGIRLAFYSRPWLLVPLSVGGAWWRLGSWRGAGALRARGWWRARAVQGAGCAAGAAAVAACAAAGLRSGLLPLVWAGPAAAADAACRAPAGPARAAVWAAAALPAAVLTSELALASLRLVVPLTGRGGAGAVPADVVVAALVAALALLATCWLLPLVVLTRRLRALVGVLAACCACACVAARGRPYSAECPQRVMVLHTRRTEHRPAPAPPLPPDYFFWIPDLDDNLPHSLDHYVGGLASARAMSAAECGRWAWCGAPYYLPARGRVPRAHLLPARAPPRAALAAALARAPLNSTHCELALHLATGPAHTVVIVSPAAGARLLRAGEGPPPPPRPAPRAPGDTRDHYFFFVYRARPHRPYTLRLLLQRTATAGGEAGGEAEGEWARVSVAGHALFGDDKLAPEHASLAAALPPWAAHTGWGADLHLYTA